MNSRMSLSCPNISSLTDNELNQIFGNGTITGLLSSIPNNSSDRDNNGMLTQSAVKTVINTLKNSGVIPTPTPTNAEAFLKKQKDIIINIQSEYCFYYARYKYSLEKLLNAIQQGYITNSQENQQVVQKYLQTTQMLNKKLNDLTQIVNGVTNEMLTSNTVLENEIVELDNKIKEQQKKLGEQNKIISSSEAVTKLNKEMVKYTEEKARYTDNLLKMYSVLNIVALGLLIYVYKSASD